MVQTYTILPQGVPGSPRELCNAVTSGSRLVAEKREEQHGEEDADHETLIRRVGMGGAVGKPSQ